jgi:ketosteroid isomerase-like protein
MAIDHAALIERFIAAMNRIDFAGLDDLLTEDYVDEWPQSGEVIHGRANFRAVLENYPRMPRNRVDSTGGTVAVLDERWEVTPLFTVVRVEGTGNVGTAIFRSQYPDGWWWIAILYELRGERIARATTLFAPTFEAPAWRAPYVETRPRDRLPPSG